MSEAARDLDLSLSWVKEMVHRGINKNIPQSETRRRGRPRNERAE